MNAKRTLAVMTGGGDAPGLNAVIRTIVKQGVTQLGWRVIGLEDSFDGLLETPLRIIDFDRDQVRGILTMGGTILGTTNHGDPFSFRESDGSVSDRSVEVAERLKLLGVEGLIAIGGDGSMGICSRLMKERGVPVIGVPKTIDNDIPGTEITFGFDTAAAFATEAVDRLHSTAESHERVMVLEVMGRDAGHLALASGLGGGADVILIPEIPFRWDAVLGKLMRRRAFKRHFSIVVVAEGAKPEGGSVTEHMNADGRKSHGGIGFLVADEIARRTGLETRCTVLGHLQRGGTPTPRDRVLASRMGHHAVELARRGEWGRMVAMRANRMDSVELSWLLTQTARQLSLDDDAISTARALGIVFGDEAQ
ncbi:MAG: ATP-dependent 6-phosphofructokinase [Planctomycetes bacterium]|nr:ATP-dependent 6-phosphofructokinase [Planctomycetota bacterium]